MRVDTSRRRVAMIWAVVAIATVVPVVIAVTSPLLAWRSPVYIAAGFGGIVAMSVLLLQPLLAGGLLPGLSICLLYTSPSPRDQRGSRMPSSA